MRLTVSSQTKIYPAKYHVSNHSHYQLPRGEEQIKNAVIFFKILIPISSKFQLRMLWPRADILVFNSSLGIFFIVFIQLFLSTMTYMAKIFSYAFWELLPFMLNLCAVSSWCLLFDAVKEKAVILCLLHAVPSFLWCFLWSSQSYEENSQASQRLHPFRKTEFCSEFPSIPR